jgi:hypothetical protein
MKKHTAPALLIIACAFFAPAQTINVTGTVVDSATSQGISGALVKLVEYPQFTTTTASNGSFTLAGTAVGALSPRITAHTENNILLDGNTLTITGVVDSKRASVDVFKSDGKRIFHAEQFPGEKGRAEWTNLWKVPGLYYVTINLDGKKYSAISLGTGRRSFPISSEALSGVLAKSAAAVTLQVTAAAYAIKNVALTSTTAAADTIRLTKEQPLNTWVNVTPNGITIGNEGLRAVIADPLRPSDLFMGAGSAGIWKSTDYGRGWSLLNVGFGYIPQGLCFAVLPTTPRTLFVSVGCGCGKIHKSTDGGTTFYTTGGGLPSDLYSLDVDPYNSDHIISGFHEADGIAESNDAGETWHVVAGTGFPTGGISWYPYFINTGVAATTAKSWIAIAQNAGSPTVTRDGGATWTVPTAVQGLTHPHGTSQVYQRGSAIFVSGGGGTGGDGVYRSTDLGATFTKVTTNTPAAIVWGTPNHVYSMFSWSCFGCAIDPNFRVGSVNGDTWTTPGVPAAMLMGTDRVAVTNDGTHYVFVGAMRNAGIWRYVEQ